MSILDSLNNIVTSLNTLSPGWYILLAAPIANIAQHFIKKVVTFTKGQNKLVSLAIAALLGLLYAALHTTWGADLSTWFQLAIVGTPVWLVGQILFHAVSDKLETLNALQTPAAPVTPVVAPVVPVAAPVAPTPPPTDV